MVLRSCSVGWWGSGGGGFLISYLIRLSDQPLLPLLYSFDYPFSHPFVLICINSLFLLSFPHCLLKSCRITLKIRISICLFPPSCKTSEIFHHATTTTVKSPSLLWEFCRIDFPSVHPSDHPSVIPTSGPSSQALGLAS